MYCALANDPQTRLPSPSLEEWWQTIRGVGGYPQIRSALTRKSGTEPKGNAKNNASVPIRTESFSKIGPPPPAFGSASSPSIATSDLLSSCAQAGDEEKTRHLRLSCPPRPSLLGAPCYCDSHLCILFRTRAERPSTTTSRTSPPPPPPPPPQRRLSGSSSLASNSWSIQIPDHCPDDLQYLYMELVFVLYYLNSHALYYSLFLFSCSSCSQYLLSPPPHSCEEVFLL